MTSEFTQRSEVLKLLSFDHKRIGDLLFHYEQSEEPTHKISFAETALNELTIHSELEEHIFYPFACKVSQEIAGTIARFYQDHEELDDLMSQLTSEQFTEEYDKIFTSLADSLQAHVRQEEQELFPLLENVDMTDILAPMRQMRAQLITREAAGHRDFTPQTLLFKEVPPRQHFA
jgi:iron-sulfur cluster repair protein YtfE (RIC family)